MAPPPIGADARVRALLADGDVRTAATAALQAVGPEVLRYLRAVLRDEAEAADAFSETAERLWRGLAAWRGDASLRTWAYRIASHVAASRLDDPWRRRGRRLVTGEASELAEELRSRTAGRTDRQRTALDALREQLTAEERTLLALRVERELPWDEVAAVLSGDGERLSADAAEKRFERLKARLARLARDQGLLG